MITPPYLDIMARYNCWQDETLYQCCDRLAVDDLHRQRAMFFGSILNTLNHILYVDQIISDLIQTKVLPTDLDPKTILYTDYDDLKMARADFNQRLLQACRCCEQNWLDEEVETWSDRLQRQRRIPRGFYYMQMFNHQTHHRSQITAELHKLGVDYGSTDLPYNPYNPF
jgi:uncharacterized damage-inducible protein DinB